MIIYAMWTCGLCRQLVRQSSETSELFSLLFTYLKHFNIVRIVFGDYVFWGSFFIEKTGYFNWLVFFWPEAEIWTVSHYKWTTAFGLKIKVKILLIKNSFLLAIFWNRVDHKLFWPIYELSLIVHWRWHFLVNWWVDCKVNQSWIGIKTIIKFNANWRSYPINFAAKNILITYNFHSFWCFRWNYWFFSFLGSYKLITNLAHHLHFLFELFYLMTTRYNFDTVSAA